MSPTATSKTAAAAQPCNGDMIDKKSLFRGTGTRPPACACPHADRLEPV
jgi:hypothetical protein